MRKAASQPALNRQEPRLLVLAVVITALTAGGGVLRHYLYSSVKPLPPDDRSRPLGEPEVWASGGAWQRNETLIRQLRQELRPREVAELSALCRRCLWHTLQTCVRVHGMGESTYVATGDIEDEWLRDSSVQVAIYFPRIGAHPALLGLLAGVLRNQAYYILQDLYANAFQPGWKATSEYDSKQLRGLGRAGFVGTRNYEADSLAYFCGLAWNYATAPGVRRPGTLLRQPLIHDAVAAAVRVWDVERHHEQRSPYRYAELPRGGLGTPTNYTGMTWSGFRPSDDPNFFGFNIPGNMFVWGALQKVRLLNSLYWHDAALERLATDVAATIRQGIETYGVVATEDGAVVYAYEVDGLGNFFADSDDPNVPSLLSAPLLGYPVDPGIYATTRARILSPINPLYYQGPLGAGMGSMHPATPVNYAWPLAWMVEALTTSNVTRRAEIVRLLLRVQCGNGLMHESVDVSDPEGQRCTRPWFEWANAMLVVLAENTLGLDCDAADAKNQAAADQGYPSSLEATIRHVWLDHISGQMFDEDFPAG